MDGARGRGSDDMRRICAIETHLPVVVNDVAVHVGAVGFVHHGAVDSVTVAAVVS